MRPHHVMAQRDIIVIGASAGGLQALTTLVKRLPGSLNATLFVVVHMSRAAGGVLPDILSRASALPVTYARDHEGFRKGHIYLARPDFHLLVTRRHIRVVHGPKENGFRPAIDPLFRSAAKALGPRVVGVVLSGALSDGTYGLNLIKQGGGVSVVQAPDDALVASMPLSAIRQVEVDHILPAADIAALILHLSTEHAGQQGGDLMARKKKEIDPQSTEGTRVAEMQQHYGPASALTCPDCGGALWEIQDGQVLRYQCHVGHQYSPDSLDSEQREAVDSALWSAVRVLEEHSELKMRMARRTLTEGMTAVSEGFEESAQDAHNQAQRIRAVLFGSGNGDPVGTGAAGGGDRTRQSAREPRDKSARTTRARTSAARPRAGKTRLRKPQS